MFYTGGQKERSELGGEWARTFSVYRPAVAAVILAAPAISFAWHDISCTSGHESLQSAKNAVQARGYSGARSFKSGNVLAPDTVVIPRKRRLCKRLNIGRGRATHDEKHPLPWGREGANYR
jgi:hypothetical protein